MNIFQNEIVRASGYMELETATNQRLGVFLSSLGYQKTSEHCWQHLDRCVYLRLVDDISTAVDPHKLKKDDIVITDSYICPVVNARTFSLPESWWGIYAHRPEYHTIGDLRDYSYLVNRIDATRMLLLMHLLKHKGLDSGVVNFNCLTPQDWKNETQEAKLKNWHRTWEELGPDSKNSYHVVYRRFTDMIPLRNHDFTHEQALQAARINIVVETYHSDDVIAFSEKIFTALCLPRPWVLFGGRSGVARLRKAGFDVLDDLVDHSYDHLTMVQDKHSSFINCALRSTHDIPPHLNRLKAAAQHNQNLLFRWRDKMESDLQGWLTDLEKELKIS